MSQLSSKQAMQAVATAATRGKKRGLQEDQVATAACDQPEQVATAACEPEETESMVCLGGAEVLKKYSLGVRRIPLKDLGVSPLNRKISGKHVHKLGHRIQTVEGFCRYRYKYGWCHEPNPDDPLEVARNTNLMAKRDRLLAPVAEAAVLFGSFAKTHLLSFLQAMASGTMYWDSSGTLMVPAPGQQALKEHIVHGMYYEVLSFEAVSKDAAGLKGLMASDNFDAGFALGETEMDLLKSIHASLAIVKPPVGCTDWDVVKQAVARSCGTRWSESDIAGIYNLAKVLGPEQVEFICLNVIVHVDVDAVTVRPGDMHLLANFHPSLLWFKVMLLTMQYFSQPEKFAPGPGGKNYGQQISKADFERLTKVPFEILQPVEKFLQQIVSTYSEKNMPEASPETVAKELPAAFLRLAKQVLLCKDFTVSDCIPYGKVEQKLRENLKLSKLPEPVAKAAAPEPVAKAAAKGTITPNITPALKFDSQGVVQDCIALARSRGLHVGVKVKCLKDLRGIKKGAFGVIVGIENEIKVKWCMGSRVKQTDAKEAMEEGVNMTLNSLAVLTSEEEKKNTVAPAAEVELPESIPWVSRNTNSGAAADVITSIVKSTLYQVYVAAAPTPEVLRVTVETPPRLVVAKHVSKRKLALIPWIQDFEKVQKKGMKVSTKSFQVVVHNVAEVFKFETPADLGTKHTMDNTDATIVYPYWQVLEGVGKPAPAGSSGKPAPPSYKMNLETLELHVPLQTYLCKESAIKAQKTEKNSILLRIPMLINTEDLVAGTSIHYEE